jgi:hypothetical protein
VYVTVVSFFVVVSAISELPPKQSPEKNVEPVPTKSEPVQLCGCVGFFVVVPAKSELTPKQSARK